MPVTVTMKDETSAGKITHEIPVHFHSDLVAVKDIIKARIYADVTKYNSQQAEYFQGLVQPTEAEQTLNGYKMKQKRMIDPEKQYTIAMEAFQKNSYFMLIDNVQANSPEQMIVINSRTEISFVKLTPLVGG